MFAKIKCYFKGHQWSVPTKRTTVIKVTKGLKTSIVYETYCKCCGDFKKLSPQEHAEW